MVEEKKQRQDLSIYRDKRIENISTGLKEQSDLDTIDNGVIDERVELFFSFDIVNSTAFKTINYYAWPYVINELFRILLKFQRL